MRGRGFHYMDCTDATITNLTHIKV